LSIAIGFEQTRRNDWLPPSTTGAHVIADVAPQPIRRVRVADSFGPGLAGAPATVGESQAGSREGPPMTSLLMADCDVMSRSKLHDELDLLRAAVEASQDAIFVVTREGRIEYVNAAAGRITGQRVEELVGRRFTDIFQPPTVDIIRRDFEVVFETGGPQYFEDRFEFQNGPIWLGTWLVPMRRPGTSEAHAVMGVARDITDGKHLEGRFLQAQKMEAIGRLAGGIAHDFNNLLTAILGYSELILDRIHDNPDLTADVEEIRKAGERASRLTHQLLASSRKQVLLPQVLDLNQVAVEVEHMLNRVIGEDIRLEVTTASSLRHIKADQGQVEQVLMNLAVNARDAMPCGGVLRIATANADLDESFARHHDGALPGRYVSLSVADTGCGMDRETLAHVFEPFFTTKGPGRGTGLGLATVYGIVKQSGGYVTITSAPGMGTTATMYLPAVDEPLAVSTDRASAYSWAPTESILLVEDESAVRELMTRTLTQFGYTILEAVNGREAMTVAEHHAGPIHLLVTDIVMPEMNGPHLAQHLLGDHPDLKVLFVSGFPQTAMVNGAPANPRTRFLAKPFTAATLMAAVQACLHESASLPEVVSSAL
jgi:PAS domain S-box-containing protein